MAKKQRVYLAQISAREFRVVRLVNTVRYEIGEYLDKAAVERLVSGGAIEVHIQGSD